MNLYQFLTEKEHEDNIQIFMTKYNLKLTFAQCWIHKFILGGTDFHSPLGFLLIWHSKYENIHFGYTVSIEMHRKK